MKIAALAARSEVFLSKVPFSAMGQRRPFEFLVTREVYSTISLFDICPDLCVDNLNAA